MKYWHFLAVMFVLGIIVSINIDLSMANDPVDIVETYEFDFSSYGLNDVLDTLELSESEIISTYTLGGSRIFEIQILTDTYGSVRYTCILGNKNSWLKHPKLSVIHLLSIMCNGIYYSAYDRKNQRIVYLEELFRKQFIKKLNRLIGANQDYVIEQIYSQSDVEFFKVCKSDCDTIFIKRE